MSNSFVLSMLELLILGSESPELEGSDKEKAYRHFDDKLFVKKQ